MTIYELKRLNQANGGVFFDKSHTRANNETLKDYRVHNTVNSKIIAATNIKSDKTYLFSRFTGRFIQGNKFSE